MALSRAVPVFVIRVWSFLRISSFGIRHFPRPSSIRQGFCATARAPRFNMMPARQIQAVTFDVGGTLIRPWPSVGHVYAEVAAQHGLRNLSPESLNQSFAAAWREKKNFQHTKEGWARLVDQTFAGLCEPPPSRAFFPAIYQRFAEADTWRIYDDVLPALDALASKDVPLAVISNWDERLRPLLRQLRLD